jgi:ERCC4-type nuclease
MANAMSTYLLSPSENRLADLFGNMAITSTIPEQKGADVLVYTNQGLIGIQVKEAPNDFLASIVDGRLARETSLLSACTFKLLLLRGRFKYWPDGRVSLPGRREASRFTEKQVRGILFDIKYVKGVDYDYVDDYEDVVAYVKHLDLWMNKDTHLALFNRPGGPKGTWIVPSAEEMQSWLLQGFEGIGPAIADSIIGHFGRLPLAWTCSLEELMRVPKLSSKRAQYLWNFLSETPTSFMTTSAPTKESASKLDGIRRMFSSG